VAGQPARARADQSGGPTVRAVGAGDRRERRRLHGPLRPVQVGRRGQPL